jgi:hypothetical protein
MENQEILDSGLASGSDLQLNSSSKDFLRQTAKWAKFLAIISIVFSAIIVIIGLFFGKFMSAMSGMQAAATGQTMPNLYSGSVGIFYGGLLCCHRINHALSWCQNVAIFQQYKCCIVK